MDFLNAEIDVNTLPKAESVNFRPVEKDYLKILRIEWLITIIALGIIAAALFFFIKNLRNSTYLVIIAITLVIFAVSWFLIQTKSFIYRGYAIREEDIIYRSGWIIRKISTSPFNRIQHSNVSTGPLERRYGLATLIIYTAGTDDADLRISGLKEEEAYTIKTWITQKISDERKSMG